jgi:prepilin-type N-terminal cleavage/methylation domain-containing protein
MIYMNQSTRQSGFTLVEMIVSLALFSVVVTISVGALLVLIASNEKLQNEQSVMTNLSFALDSMTREMRTGSFYYCASRPQYNSGGAQAIFDASDSQEGIGTNVRDCATGNSSNQNLQGVSFIEGGDSISGSSNRILYFYDGTTGPDGGKILRRVGDGPPQSVTSSGIFVTAAEFFVTGSRPQSAGGALANDQPTVTIVIEAKEADNPAAKTYQIQTTVTQRSLDI